MSDGGGLPAERRSPVWDCVDGGAGARPDQAAVVIVGADGADRPPVTYAGLRDLGLRAAGALHARRVGPGSIVFSAVGNSEESVALSAGVARVGALWAPADHDLTTEQLSNLLRLYAPAVAIVCDDILEAAQTFLRDAPGDAGSTQLLGEATWRALLSDAAGGPAPPEGPVDDDATSLLLLTSGTTGMPKSVMISNVQLRTPASKGFPFTPAGSCVVYFGTPAWISYSTLLLRALSGGHSLVLGPGYSKDPYFQAVERHRPQILFFWPDVILDFVALPEPAQARIAEFTTLLLYGGARTPVSDLLRICQALPRTKLVQAYGSSEVSPVSTLMPWDHSAAVRDETQHFRLRSVGKPGSKVRVVDDGGQPVSPGVAGWIQVRPDPATTFQGYYQNASATAKKYTSDGWFIMGDMGRLDEGGYLYIDGRDSETIVLVSGDNVYPNEVEGAIADLPGVLDVGVAKVVSGDGAINEVGAFIQVSEGSELSVEDVKAQCNKRLGQTWTHPTHIFFQTDKLPRNKNGKCLKAKLTERAAELLQQTQGDT